MNPEFETPVVQNGGLVYKIQLAMTSDGVWKTRHLWFRAGEWIEDLWLRSSHGPLPHYARLEQ